MSLATVLWLIDFLGNLRFLFGILSCFAGIAFLALVIIYAEKHDCYDFNTKEHETYIKKAFIFLLCFLITAMAIPYERTMYLMVSSHYLKQSDIPEKVLKILNDKLDDVLKEKKEK